ncbi:hypothetical protein FACS189440_18450 [Bacteroidia bacterium]|nr:hypothetical protein FACS189423_11810 [Bacteroidia bacterium]GHT50652.1 hypothetical protein FACS189440_18450 [Bacteroidia bacterium]
MEAQEKVKNKKGKKVLGIFLGIIVLALAIFLYVRFYYPFGEGVKAGQLNYVVYKGYVFKTYEGKLIQSGLKSGIATGQIQSNEFIFSVSDKAVAEKLMLAGGQEVDLHYKEYLGTLPWRGYSKYVVDSIIAIKQ